MYKEGFNIYVQGRVIRFTGCTTKIDKIIKAFKINKAHSSMCRVHKMRVEMGLVFGVGG